MTPSEKRSIVIEYYERIYKIKLKADLSDENVSLLFLKLSQLNERAPQQYKKSKDLKVTVQKDESNTGHEG